MAAKVGNYHDIGYISSRLISVRNKIEQVKQTEQKSNKKIPQTSEMRCDDVEREKNYISQEFTQIKLMHIKRFTANATKTCIY